MSCAFFFWGLKFVLVMTSLAFESNWDQEARDYVLKFHNDKRREENGCNMNKLVYDMELERQSRQWAENCVFKHDVTEERGVNLAWDPKNSSETDLIQFWFQRWFDEKRGKEDGLWQSRNYIQMVWASTQKVGCYSLRCENLAHAQKDAWYLVCYYTPKSDLTGGIPYTTNCTRKCKEGQLEDKGLCVAEDNGTPTTGSGFCRDNWNNCHDLAKVGDCERNNAYMLIECKKSCNVCVSDGAGVAEQSKQNTGSTTELGGHFKWLVSPLRRDDDKKLTTPISNDRKTRPGLNANGGDSGSGGGQVNEADLDTDDADVINRRDIGSSDDVGGDENGGEEVECQDKDEKCFQHVIDHGCDVLGWQYLNCPRSCHLCESVCQDLDPSCPSKAESGQCESDPTYMKKNCEKSCKLCAVKGYCDNYHLDCEKHWSTLCHHETVKRVCRKMCNTCSTEKPEYPTAGMTTVTFSPGPPAEYSTESMSTTTFSPSPPTELDWP